METDLPIKDILTLSISSIALILSLINIKHLMWRDKIKLRISPGLTVDPTDHSNTPILAVTVVNLSYISITLSGVEIFIKDANKKENTLFFATVGHQLPKRLEPRSNETVIFSNFMTETPEIRARIAKATHITARTACGYTIQCKFNPNFYVKS